MSTLPPDRFEEIDGEKIRRCDIPSMFTDDVVKNIITYRDYQRFGLPHDGGWANHPSIYIELLRILSVAEAEAAKERKHDQ